jgi:4-amino-4-deoxy-L-arabinose transferase-like glycosyltransferase
VTVVDRPRLARAAVSDPIRRRRIGPALAVISFVALVFLIDAAPRISMPFGGSHDGRNAALWASGARSIAENGLEASRLGAVADERETYAHHPPGIYLETAATRAIGGDSETALRAPAWLGSLASIGLLWFLLRELGGSRVATSSALALAVGSPMFLLYGPMLNHEALSLPFAIAALLILARARHGNRDSPWLAGFVGLAAALLSWEGVMLAIAIGAIELVRWWRTRRLDPATAAMTAASAAGLGLTVLWLWWANGGFAEMGTAYTRRAGSHGFGAADFVSSQITYLRWAFPVWSLVLGALGLLIALRRGRDLPVVAVAAGVPAVYLVGFLSGSYYHTYWNFWLVIVVAIGVVTVADDVLSWSSSSTTRHRAVSVVVLAASAGALLAGTRIQGVDAEAFVDGANGGAVVRSLDLPASQPALLVWAGIGEPAWWIEYYTRRPYVVLRTDVDVQRAVAADPSQTVLVWRLTTELHRPGDYESLRAKAFVQHDSYAAVSVADLGAVVTAD